MNMPVILLTLCFALPLQNTPDPPNPAAYGDRLPDMPSVTLAPLADDDAARDGAIRTRVEELRRTAQQAEAPTARVDLQLAAANLLLAELTEPAATRFLLNAVAPGDAEQVAAVVAEADALLNDATGSLLQASGVADTDTEWAARSTRRLDSLKAFSSALAAVLVPKQGDEAVLEERRAAAKLSFLLEDPDVHAAAAARLWQACLRVRHDQRDQVLAMLSPALADLPRDSRRPSFFQRLLRCRILADQGGHAAAMALLIQMEERVDVWFLRQQRPDDARRAVYYTELHVLRAWHDKLSGEEKKTEREWIVTQMHRIRNDHFDAENSAVARLEQAIPILAPAP